MSYTKHLLSSSISLKNKEVLINDDGEKIEGSGLLGGRPILRRKSILDAKFFWRGICFGERPKFVKEDLILERKQQATRKQHAKK